MNTKVLTTMSAIALMAAAPAFAQTESNAQKTLTIEKSEQTNNQDTPDMPRITTEDIEQSWESTKSAARESYNDIHAVFIEGETETPEGSYIVVDSRMTATGILDKSIYDANGDTVGTVNDILVDSQGEPRTVVISHGGFLGIGSREVVIDYDKIMRREVDGDIVMPVSKETVANAQRFSYDRADAVYDPNIRVMPEGYFRISELLGSNVTNAQENIVAQTDNIYFKNGKAEYLIVSFDETFGMGGNLAAMDYDELQLSRKANGDYQFGMNETQSAEFEVFRKTYE